MPPVTKSVRRHLMASTPAVVALLALALTATHSALTPPAAGAHDDSGQLRLDSMSTIRESADVAIEGDQITILTSGDIVFVDYSNRLPGSSPEIHFGQMTEADTCSFEMPYYSPANKEIVVEERELATDFANCIMITEVGERTLSEVRELDALHGDDELNLPVDQAAEEESSQPQATLSAFHRARYRDPAFLTVNSVTNFVTWRYSGGCVNSSSHSRDYSFLSLSGWSVTSIETLTGRDCSRAWTNVWAEFSNTSFCVTNPTTRVSYHPNRINGYSNGTYLGTALHSATGGCSSWLTYSSQHGFY